ncbi:MAG TPA: ABC transporter permease [Trebonia sp.]|jgi:ABC-type dipeptide/oligopeptide/nickel transport system permease subunit|nr:ABC transporter permease [Trebonia sp.]
MRSVAHTWRRLPLKAKIGAGLLGLFILVAIIGPSFTPYDPSFQNTSASAALRGPSGQHLLGTTQNGQDVLSQLLVGIRMTLILAAEVGVIATVLSVLVGVTSAYLGGIWDEILSLLSNVFLVIPSLPLLILLLGYLQQRGDTATIIVLSVLGWPWGARVIRAQTLTIRNRDFVAAARETGEQTWRIILFDIIPNQVSLIAANFVNTVLYAISASVALAFVGLADLNSWSLGTMLFWAQSAQALTLGAWWWFLPPGIAVALIGTSLVLLNTGIDELGNPRLRDARFATKVAGRRVWPTDPTPVLADLTRGKAASFLHSFSRESVLEETTTGGKTR